MAISNWDRKAIITKTVGLQICFVLYISTLLLIDYYFRTNGFQISIPVNSSKFPPNGVNPQLLNLAEQLGLLFETVGFCLVLKKYSKIKMVTLIAFIFIVSFLEIEFLNLFYVLSAHLGGF